MNEGAWGAAIPVCPPQAVEQRDPDQVLARHRMWERLAAQGLVWAPSSLWQPPGERPPHGSALVLSWPGEWTAEHWRDAAFHVLHLEEALRTHGWSLRKVRAEWIQFRRCRPVWISQAALAPFDGRHWLGRESFVREFLEPLRRGRENVGPRLWIRLCAWRQRRCLDRLAAPGLPAERGQDLLLLRRALERCARGCRWSPWQVHEAAAEPAGIAGVVVREEVRLRRAALVYEWRRPRARGARLMPAPRAAWVRFYGAAEEAAADYLEQRAADGAVLPLVDGALSEGHPRAALAADLGVAVGAGNLPADLPGLALFASRLRNLAKAAVVEFLPGSGPDWEQFRAVFSSCFRILSVTEAGAGRRVCVMERAGAGAAPLLVA